VLDLAISVQATTGLANPRQQRAVVVKWIDLADELARDAALTADHGPVDSTSLKLAGVVDSIDDLQPTGTFMFRMSGG